MRQQRFISGIIIFLCIPIALGRAQTVSERVIEASEPVIADITVTDQTTLVIPVDNNVQQIESMALSDSALREVLAADFEARTAESAQNILHVYLENGFTMDDVAAILKGAGFKLENVFKGMLGEMGESGIKDVVGALLKSQFKSGDVFKVGVNYLRSQHENISDEDIIETLVGETIGADALHKLTQEVFMSKMQGVSVTSQSGIILSMINAGFAMDEITGALVDSGFSLANIANIYSYAGIDIGLTYDLLIGSGSAVEPADVLSALISSAYKLVDTYHCVFHKLNAAYSVVEITALIIGGVDPETGPSKEQLSHAVLLAGIMQEEEVTVVTICDSLLSAGFDLTDTAAVLAGTGVEAENAFAALLDAGGGQQVAAIAPAMIENDYDVETVFELAVSELKLQGEDLTQIVTLLIGDIDAEKGPSSLQKSYAAVLVNLLFNQGEGLQEIAGGFLSHSFTLDNVAEVFKN
jgi:hypothetical protein